MLFLPVRSGESWMASAVPLDDLTFESGSALLGQGQFGSLAALAAYLKENPQRTIALVGHTDASGNLATNIALSTARAASVRDRLIRDFGIPAAQVSAEGVGYLAPRDSNLTQEGRARQKGRGGCHLDPVDVRTGGQCDRLIRSHQLSGPLSM